MLKANEKTPRVRRPCGIAHHFFLLTALLSSVGLAHAADPRPQTFCNPMDLPYRFELQGSSWRQAADPMMVQHKGVYWLFASHVGGYLRSTDLVHWSLIEPTGLPLEEWAPAVVVIKDKFYFTSGGTKGSFTTDDPDRGQWTNITTYPFVVEDPCTFLDDDGRLYLYDGCNNTRPLRVRELDPKTFLPKGDPIGVIVSDTRNHGWEVPGDNNQNLTGSPWIEGSFMSKIAGKYYWQYAGPGTQFKSYGDGVYVGDKPTGPFVYQPYSPFSFKPTGFITGSGHSATFQASDDQYWHITCLTISKRGMFERRLGLFPTGTLPDGQLVTNTYLGDYPQFVAGAKKDAFRDNLAGWMLLSRGKPVTASSTLKPEATRSFDVQNAVDEDARTWWSAATGDAREWLQVDLTKPCRIEAVQLNFADQGSTQLGRLLDDGYRYYVDVSDDGTTWKTIIDRRDKGRDASHDYVQLDAPVTSRYVRVTNVHTPAGGKFSFFDLRVFGSGMSAPPGEVKDIKVTREANNPRMAHVSWTAASNAEFYIVRYGLAPDRLFGNYQVYGATSIDIPSLNVGTNYYFTVDAVNDTQITKGTATQKQ